MLLTCAIVIAWFYRHSVISMLPGEVGIARDLNVCGRVSEPIAVDIMPILNAMQKYDVFFQVTRYEAELENGGTVRVNKSENDEPVGEIKFGKNKCFERMNEESSQKWHEYLKQMSQKNKLP